jgi:tetratricopeptide (TPR) repeat protein
MKKIILIFALIFCGFNLFAEDIKQIQFADALYDSGDYYRAISEYKRYIFYNGEGKFVKNAVYKIAMSYLMAGKYDEAADSFDGISAKYSGDLKYLSMLGEAMAAALKKDYVYSTSVADRILNDDGASKYLDKAHYLIGFNYMDLGDFKASDAEFGKIEGTELGGSSASIRALLNKSTEIPTRSPVISGILSLIIPGSGHMYCGRWADGIISLLLNSFFIYNTYEARVRKDNVQELAYGIPEIFLYLSSVYGSVVSADRFNNDEVREFIKSADQYKVDIIKVEF